MKTYQEMCEEAADNCRTEGGEYFYDGYTGGNALRMYVYEKYYVSVADEAAAFIALEDAL